MSKPRSAPRRQVDGVLLLDKPAGITSNAALQKARWLFNAAKAGHTGTLDPMATGLLPLCFGEATKFAGELLHADKAYRATVQLGVTTDTADAEGRVIETRQVTVSDEQLRQVMSGFVGVIKQVPPMYSALKRDGKPLYEYARAGIELEREPRQVTIYRLELLSFVDGIAIFDVECSKGTYVRTLAADIGASLGCGAHLTALRRTRIGNLNLVGAVTLIDLELVTIEGRDAHLSPADALLAGLPRASLTDAETERVLHGQGIRREGNPGQRYRLYSVTDNFLGVGESSLDGWLNPRRLVAATAVGHEKH